MVSSILPSAPPLESQIFGNASSVFAQAPVPQNIEAISNTNDKVNGYVIAFFAVVASIFLLCSLAFVELEVVLFSGLLSIILLVYFAWDNDCDCDDSYSYSSNHYNPTPADGHVVNHQASRQRAVVHVHHNPPAPTTQAFHQHVPSARPRRAPHARSGFTQPITIQTRSPSKKVVPARLQGQHMSLNRTTTRTSQRSQQPVRKPTRPTPQRGAPRSNNTKHMPLQRPDKR